MNPERRQINQLLLALEEELKRLDFWRTQPPSAAALASRQPFCIDRLDLDQWLQWLFIPRLRALLEGGRPLPEECGVTPVAEEYFRDADADCRHLLVLIEKIDARVSALP